jgi:hypothetical protein
MSRNIFVIPYQLSEALLAMCYCPEACARLISQLKKVPSHYSGSVALCRYEGLVGYQYTASNVMMTDH